MKPTLLISLIPSLSLAQKSYPISGASSVNCRTGPGTTYAVARAYPEDHIVTLTCQIEGADIFGNVLWDKTSDGCYVSDYYVKTGVDGFVVGRCEDGGAGNCPPPKSNRETVDLIAEFEGFVPDVCEFDFWFPRCLVCCQVWCCGFGLGMLEG